MKALWLPFLLITQSLHRPARGGERAANRTLEKFLQEGIDRYADCRNHPDDDATSGLSAYLHFGHISVHQVFQELNGS